MLKYIFALVFGATVGRLSYNLFCYSFDASFFENFLVDLLLIVVGCMIAFNEHILNIKGYSKVALKSIISAAVGSLIVAYPSSLLLDIPFNVSLSIALSLIHI